MNTPELMVFDLACITANDHKDVHRVLQRVIKKIHIRITIEEANKVMGIPKREAIKMLLQQHKYPYISDLLILEIHQHFVNKMTDFYLKHPSVMARAGVTEVFKMCKQKAIKVVVVTAFDRLMMAPLLERMGWVKQGLIDASITNDEVAHSGTYRDMIFRAMELTGVTDVKKVAQVGDSISDLEEGVAAGCGWVIGVNTESNNDDFSNGPHTHMVEEFSELNSILNW